MSEIRAELTPEFLKAAMNCSSRLQRHVDFLKKLNDYVKGMTEYTEKYCEPFPNTHAEGSRDAYLDVWHKIEQFQAEQKVSDDNLNI